MSTSAVQVNPAGPEQFLTGEQCAAKLNTSLFTFRRWVRRYGIPVHKNGPKSVRYLWSEVLAALAKNGLNQPPPQQPPQTTEGQP